MSRSQRRKQGLLTPEAAMSLYQELYHIVTAVEQFEALRDPYDVEKLLTEISELGRETLEDIDPTAFKSFDKKMGKVYEARAKAGHLRLVK